MNDKDSSFVNATLVQKDTSACSELLGVEKCLQTPVESGIVFPFCVA